MKLDLKKNCSSSLIKEELCKIISLWNEDTSNGLRKKNYIASYELLWRGGEAVNYLINYFTKEIDNVGIATDHCLQNGQLNENNIPTYYVYCIFNYNYRK